MTVTAFQRDAFQFGAFSIGVNDVAASPTHLPNALSTSASAHAQRGAVLDVDANASSMVRATRLRSARVILEAELNFSSGWSYPADRVRVAISAPYVAPTISFGSARAKVSFMATRPLIHQNRVVAAIAVNYAEVQIE